MQPTVHDVPERYIGRGETFAVAFEVDWLSISRGTLITFARLWKTSDFPSEVPESARIYLLRQHNGTPLTLTLSRGNLLRKGVPFLASRADEEKPDGWRVEGPDGEEYRG